MSGVAIFTTVRSPSVTLPLVGDEVGEVVLEEHAGGGGVAPVVHLTAPGVSWVRNNKDINCSRSNYHNNVSSI